MGFLKKPDAFAAYKLFVELEGKEMLGKKYFNFVVLTVIFLLTLASISFSHSSLEYLRFKMEDPFINWVDIIRDGKFDRLKQDLQNDGLKVRYQYSSYEMNQNLLYMFRSDQGKDLRFEGRTIDPNSSLLGKIFDGKNVIQSRGSSLYEEDYGLIVTQEMATRLGFEKTLPSYINMSYPMDTLNANQLGLVSETRDGYYSVALPVIAIVKQLPDMMSFIATPFFYSQRKSQDDPFDQTRPEYNNQLVFFIPLMAEKLEVQVKEEITQKLQSWRPGFVTKDVNLSWALGKRLTVTFNNNSDPLKLNKFCYELLSKFKNEGLVRTYDYNFIKNNEEVIPDYLSIHFNSLDSIRSFQQFVKDEYEVKIDMSQIDSKENFNFVNKMGITLTGVLILISSVFIFTFIFFLLRTHFLKIKKNIGTFKAFGVTNNELTLIYLTIMFIFTVCAFGIAFCFTWFLQLFSIQIKCQIDEKFAYLDILSTWTVIIFIMAIVTSMVATWMVIHSLLKATPGDLIYDRDNK